MGKKLPDPKNLINPGHFGPAIIGEEEYKRETDYKAKGRNVFGPLVTGVIEEDEEEVEVEPQQGISIQKIADALEANPTVLDALRESEAKRAGGPRKGALALFLKAEQAKGEQTRPEVVKELKAQIGG